MMAKSSGRTTLLAALCGLMAFPMLGACNLENVPQALVIRGNRVPDTGCVLNAAAAGGKVRLKGTLDMSLGRRYDAYLIVENRFMELQELTAFEDDDARLDGSAVSFETLEIVHTLPAGVLSDGAFQTALSDLSVPTPGSTISVPISGFVAPDELGITQATLVPDNLGQAIRAFSGFAQGVDVEIGVEVRISGIRGDGTIVKSAPFFYSINACNNCLVVQDQALSVVSSPPSDVGLTDIYPFGEVCLAGQDVAVSNLFCAAFGPGGVTPDDCKFNRCLGLASSSLQCGSDGQVLAAPVVAE